MAELTPEERHRIYLEEKTRMEARESLVAEALRLKASANMAKAGVDVFSSLVGCGCVLFVAVILAVIFFSPKKSPEEEARDAARDEKITASVMASTFVEKRMKAPGSADFPAFDGSHAEALGGERYAVRAYVDSENGFGAKLRTQWVAVVRHVRGDEWELEKLRFEDP